MSKLNNADEPANPVLETSEDFCVSIGLTKREQFAAMAMHTVLDKYNPYECGDFDSSDWATTAKNAVGLADALLKELETTK